MNFAYPCVAACGSHRVAVRAHERNQRKPTDIGCERFHVVLTYVPNAPGEFVSGKRSF